MTTEEVISALKDDYAIRAGLKKRGLLVHEELEEDIEDLEQSCISSHVIPKLEAYAKELLKDLECEILLAVKKDQNGEITVTDEFVLDEMPPVPYPEEETPAEEEAPNVEEEPVVEEATEIVAEPAEEIFPRGIVLTMRNRYQVTGHDLRVTFPDGVVYVGRNTKETFIKTLRKLGLDRIPAVGLYCAGYNLVDSRRRLDPNHIWQEQVGNKWIYINISNIRKVEFLLRISNYYDLNLKIEAI